MVICGSCQTSNSPKAKFCVKCGANLRPEGMVTQTQTVEKAQPEPAPEQKAPPLETKSPQELSASLQNLAGPDSMEGSIVSYVEKGEQPVETKIERLAQIDTPAPRSPVVSDVGNLLAEHHRVLSAQIESAVETPVQLWLNFPGVLVAGCPAVVEVKFESNSTLPLQDIELSLESNGLTGGASAVCRRLAPSQSPRVSVEITPAKVGTFILRCRLRGVCQDQAYAYWGGFRIKINEKPDPKLVLNIGDIQCVRGQANAALGGEFGHVNISNLVQPGAIRTLNDLLSIDLPEAYGRVPLELDYEVSRIDITKSGSPRKTTWSIPKKFLAHAQSGTKLKLEPLDSADQVAAIHLVARDEFKLGRSRQDADFLTWFWPRSAENDERTRRLSKVHVVAETHGDKLVVRDAGSANRATFEGHPLSENENDLIDQRGTLILSHEYHLDVTPFESTLEGPLSIANERLWSGPPAKGDSSVRGCVRFMPINSEVALHNTVWLFTDANFGCSKLNPLVLTLPGVNEVEGRFHHYRGCFWIESLKGGTSISVDEHRLTACEIVPLVNGARVVIGKTAFRSTIEP
jgi:hypothetical protein